ncbi:phospholipase D family protein [Cohnella hashimotonis]|uniref:phospholipase D n=1 Tax=Cohnella hashimotonis TaxID=2826895 RepID=A0ABT6TD41_9BACL|nr:phospholipase D family protein [Cohnella hashimotonis]MDI4644741.1 phospholipase D family protein [Cohnella hashimotonis]
MKKGVGVILAAMLLLPVGGCGSSSSTASSSAIGKGNVQWAFTQGDQHPEKLLIGVIQSAKETLDVAIYSLTYPDIVAAIRDAHRRGVAVRLLTDRIQASGKTQKEALKLLGSAGIPIKINSHSGLMHLKMTVADGQVATTGSFNYSKAASTTNDEMLVVLRDATAAASFEEAFERAWNDREGYETLSAAIAEDDSPSKQGKPAPSVQAQQPDEGEDVAEPPVASCASPQIKGNINSKGDKLYHVPGGKSYDRTKPEQWFCSEADAEAAGFRKAAG